MTWCEKCQDDIGGSHYHCGACGEVSGMMGHYTTGVYFEGRFIKFNLTKPFVGFDGVERMIERGVMSCQPEYDDALESIGFKRLTQMDGKRILVRLSIDG